MSGWNMPDGVTAAMLDRYLDGGSEPQDLDDAADDAYDRQQDEDGAESEGRVS